MPKLFKPITFAAAIIVASTATAGPILDQTSTPTGKTTLYSTQTDLFSPQVYTAAQSFTVGLDGTLFKIAFGITGSGTATLDLFQSQNGPFGFSGLLYSKTTILPDLQPGPGEFDWSSLPSFDLSAGNIEVTPGEELYFTVTPNQGGNGVFSYYNGQPFVYTLGASTYGIDYGFFTYYGDFGSVHSFQTYVDTGASGNDGAAPEPATWAMMVVGFGVAGLAFRRKMRSSEAKFNAKIKRAELGG